MEVELTMGETYQNLGELKAAASKVESMLDIPEKNISHGKVYNVVRTVDDEDGFKHHVVISDNGTEQEVPIEYFITLEWREENN
jgi:hypothetical protein